MPPFGLPDFGVTPSMALPLWLGTVRDVAAAANVTPAGAISWRQSGDVDRVLCTGNGKLTAAHTAAQDLTSGTIHIQGDILSHYSGQVFFRKTGTGVRYQCYSTNGSNLVLYDGTSVSSLNVSMVGHTSLTVAWTGGQKPEFYLSGLHAGTGSLVVNTAGTDQSLTFLGDGVKASDQAASMFVMYPAELTAAQVATLHSYGASRFTPRKQWPGGGLTTSDPKYVDNIQTARETLANVVAPAAQLSNTGLDAVTGTWAISSDATGRYVECVANGRLQRQLIGADGFTTSEFTQTGSATLTKNPSNFQIDATAGDKIRSLVLAS